ncbi:HIT family protein [Aquihabitans sp. G128]|uniref:HIT family protein n=1 Tax=Aquihabitans sp. G128 TaxID=2849779 RepID=UPI001C21C0C6|nr:HIT family protein [Aquihabitans sp. G128]QXC62880.1 HIT family protein [Aquihabitans sp. G128]
MTEPAGTPASDPSCTFCRIVAGEEAAHVVLDDEVAVGFLDVRPLFPGHVLLVPRPHVVSLPDLPAASVAPLFQRVQQLSVAVRDAMGAKGTFVAMNNVVSQSVPHLHVHVVPRTKGDGLKGFFWPRTRYADVDHAAATAASIAAALEELSPPA